MFKGKDENMSGLLEEMHLFYFATKEFISLNWLTWASHFSHQFNMFAAFPMGRNGRNIRSLSQQGHLPRKWRKPLPQCWADTGRGQSWPAWYHEAQNRLVHLFPHLSLSLHRHPEGQSCAILGVWQHMAIFWCFTIHFSGKSGKSNHDLSVEMPFSRMVLERQQIYIRNH